MNVARVIIYSYPLRVFQYYDTQADSILYIGLSSNGKLCTYDYDNPIILIVVCKSAYFRTYLKMRTISSLHTEPAIETIPYNLRI